MNWKQWRAKWTTWEYLPWWLANGPVYAFYLWFAIRARHLFFFSNVNPAIPLGGAVGESKSDILALIPPDLLPPGAIAEAGEDFEAIKEKIRAAGIDFPLIAKPDVGERGFLVKKISDWDALRRHLEQFPVRFIIQTFIDEPVEASVLFHRFPHTGAFDITSVCIKNFLSVEGDGQSDIRALMQKDVRAAFQVERFERESPDLLKKTPNAGERILLEPIGNHIRGTMFLNGGRFITPEMKQAFLPICEQIKGIYYGRFDLKCASFEALQRGEVKIMELNGILGEPAHVYDPTYGMRRAYADFYRHWRIIYRLHQAQKAGGTRPVAYREAFRIIKGYFQYKKSAESR